MRWIDRIGEVVSGDEHDIVSLNSKVRPHREAVRPMIGASVATMQPRTPLVRVADPVNGITGTLSLSIRASGVRKQKPVARALMAAKLSRSTAILQRMLIARPHYSIGITTKVPSPQRLDPVRTTEALLFPNVRTKSAMFSALTPTGLATTVVIQTAEVDGTVRVTGGSITLSCSGLPLRTNEEIEALRKPWTDALKTAGHGQQVWRFTPLNVRSLRATIHLPSQHLVKEPTVSTNADTVEVVTVIELTAAAAQAWKQALEANDPTSLVGSVTLDYSFAAEQRNGQMSTQSQSVTATIGTIVTESIRHLRVLRAEVGVEARLIVRGHPIVDRVALGVRSEAEVETMILPSDGGEVSMTLATASTEDAAITWTAEVSFSPPSWPIVVARGILSQAQGWTEILAPATWLRPLDVMTLYVNEDGIVIETETESSATQVTGSIELEADFLEGRPLHTTFEGRHTEMVTMHLPDPPNQSRGQLTLTAMVLRQGHSRMISHELDPNDRWVVMKIFPDARVEFSTNTSARTEGSRGAPERLELDTLF